MQLIYLPKNMAHPTHQLLTSFESEANEECVNSPYVCVISLRACAGFEPTNVLNFLSSELSNNIPPKIIDDCKMRKCLIAIDDSVESAITDTYIDAIKSFTASNEIPDDLFIFLSGQADHPSAKVVSTQVFETDWVLNLFENAAPTMMNIDKPYAYLCYNRHWNGHREFVVDSLLREDILKYGLVSLSDDSKTCPLSKISASLKDMLPLLLDEKIGYEHRNLANSLNEFHFNQTHISLINESFYFDINAIQPIFPTEKTFKAILMGHPFLVNGGYKFLDHLRSLGYKTFSPFLDESYDNEPDTRTRISMVTESLKKFISDISRENRQSLLSSLYEIAEFNRQVLLNKKGQKHPLLDYAKKVLT